MSLKSYDLLKRGNWASTLLQSLCTLLSLQGLTCDFRKHISWGTCYFLTLIVHNLNYKYTFFPTICIYIVCLQILCLIFFSTGQCIRCVLRVFGCVDSNIDRTQWNVSAVLREKSYQKSGQRHVPVFQNSGKDARSST